MGAGVPAWSVVMSRSSCTRFVVIDVSQIALEIWFLPDRVHPQRAQGLPLAGRQGSDERPNISSSGSDSDAAEDKVPDMLSERLAAFPENCRRFKYAELEAATRRPGATLGLTAGWDSSCVVGEGGFGKVGFP